MCRVKNNDYKPVSYTHLVYKVLEYCRNAAIRFAKAQKDAGADATSIGEAYAGPNLISPDMYHDFAFEHEKIMAQEVQDYGIPLSLHLSLIHI